MRQSQQKCIYVCLIEYEELLQRRDNVACLRSLNVRQNIFVLLLHLNANSPPLLKATRFFGVASDTYQQVIVAFGETQ